MDKDRLAGEEEDELEVGDEEENEDAEEDAEHIEDEAEAVEEDAAEHEEVVIIEEEEEAVQMAEEEAVANRKDIMDMFTMVPMELTVDLTIKLQHTNTKDRRTSRQQAVTKISDPITSNTSTGEGKRKKRSTST